MSACHDCGWRLGQGRYRGYCTVCGPLRGIARRRYLHDDARVQPSAAERARALAARDARIAAWEAQIAARVPVTVISEGRELEVVWTGAIG